MLPSTALSGLTFDTGMVPAEAVLCVSYSGICMICGLLHNGHSR
jgi:hypothetical protein